MIEYDTPLQEAIEQFCSSYKFTKLTSHTLERDGVEYLVVESPFDHSDDIIVNEEEAKCDAYILAKIGTAGTKIKGWTTHKELTKASARDIFRNGNMSFMVHDTNIEPIESLIGEEEQLKSVLVINKQKAESLGNKEMINGLIAGLHHFCKQIGLYFKDINQTDECIIGDKKVKVYHRDMKSDEDMLVKDAYFEKHKEIDNYVLCKEKGGAYIYMGHVTRSVVEGTRVVQMIGQDSDKASGSIRRIFAEQYSPMSDLIPIPEEAEEKVEVREQEYVSLHVHSEFSVGDAYGSPVKLAKAMKRRGFIGGALTDHGTLAGAWVFQKAMLEEGLKPIIGCELYMDTGLFEKRKHITVWVKNEKGWRNLLELQERATHENFYYNPIVKLEWLLEKHEGLMIGSGCVNSDIHTLIREERFDEAEKLILQFKETFGGDFYGEIQPTTVIGNQDIMQAAHRLYKKHNVKEVFTNDVHYHSKEQKKVHDAIKAIAFNKEYGSDAGYGDDCFYLMQDNDIAGRLITTPENNWMIQFIDEAKANTFEVLRKANFLIEPPKENDTLPKLGATAKERKARLRQIITEGLPKHTPYKYEGEVKERLDLEVDRMLGKGYENYFLLVYDLIKWSKDNGIMVGPGRGSVGASLAAYAMNITTCDPLEYDLLFDRFMSEIRRDMPDVDMDFQDNRRKEVYEYLINRFGQIRCAKVATYARFHAKGLMRDLGRIFKIPIPEIEKVASLVIERSGGDARASFTMMDTFEEFEEAKKFKEKYPLVVELAIALEGNIRHKGMHAAAMVVTEKPMSAYVPITKISGEVAIEWEKNLVEDMKLNKLDILGLKTLGVINDCLAEIKKVTGEDVVLPSKFEDKKVYENVFANGKTLGVFQFETVGLSKLSKILRIDEFKLLHDATTLFRPGALHSGQTMQYVNRRNGEEEAKSEHHLLDTITADTKGIILYQEQIMQIMNQIGGMSWATAEMARKVITKRKGKKAFEEMREEFVRNAGTLHGMSEEEAKKIYDVVSTFGSYSFNKAHAVEYSVISYWCGWLKTYYPQQFYKSILKHEADDTKLMSYLQEAKSVGLEVEYPHINKSEAGYNIVDNTIYSGFTSIKGIGAKASEKILAGQPYSSMEDFKKRCKVSKKVLFGLAISDCFRDFDVNKRCVAEGLVQGLVQIDDYTDVEWAQLLMAHTSLQPKIDIKTAYEWPRLKYSDIDRLGAENGGQVGVVRGIVTDILNKDKLLRPEIKNHTTEFEHHMVYLNINDGTGNLAVQINPWTYTAYKSIVHDLLKRPVIVHGVFAADGQKMVAELLQEDVIHFYGNKSKTSNPLISSSVPAVSKKGKSYYRLKLTNGLSGMCFRFSEHLVPGMEVAGSVNRAPFIDITVLKRNEYGGIKENERNNSK